MFTIIIAIESLDFDNQTVIRQHEIGPESFSVIEERFPEWDSRALQKEDANDDNDR